MNVKFLKALSVYYRTGKMTPKHECPPADTAWSVFRPHGQVAEGILEALPIPPGNRQPCFALGLVTAASPPKPVSCGCSENTCPMVCQ